MVSPKLRRPQMERHMTLKIFLAGFALSIQPCDGSANQDLAHPELLAA
jgi:hypothetical protein